MTAAAQNAAAVPLVWIFLRTTGIVALLLLTIAVVGGIASPAVRRPAARLSLISVHTAASVTGLVLLVGHILLAVADSFVDVPFSALLIPGTSVWEPLWVGAGTVAVDLLLLVAITSATRRRAPGVWRTVHLLTYPAFGVAWLHALNAGTDGGSAWMIGTAAAAMLAVSLATVYRLAAPGRPAVGGLS